MIVGILIIIIAVLQLLTVFGWLEVPYLTTESYLFPIVYILLGLASAWMATRGKKQQ